MNKRIKKKKRKQYDDDYSKELGFKSDKERKNWVSYMINS